ncbi:MAG: aminotransferase class V-fold PLP-dependent enzyme [Spirochaetaceae bacterium]|jgi:cysteine desulfurase family protein|nr:aminotransferase class V-fold PLP-dependent enzyme [Spirochaetaceae bacterium]
MIYANYAATTPALSPGVTRELRSYLGETHLNAARNFEGLEAGAIALRARKALARLFGAESPLQVVFTSGATAGLNLVIQGLVRPGDHVLATMVEHNAVARPLEALRKTGIITVDWLPCDAEGFLDPQQVRQGIKKNTRLLILSHASNVLGTLLPVAECFSIAREQGVFTLLDAAQTAGVIPLTRELGADGIVFTGHKGLGALAGIGGLVLGEEVSQAMRPWIAGGTGSASASLDMPLFLPDKFEPGTQNTMGILSLAVSVEELLDIGVETIREQEKALTSRFISGLEALSNVRLYGPKEPDHRTAPVSLGIQGSDPGEVAGSLFEKHRIVTRSGLHCAPLAHKTAGTYPEGTVRFSFGRGSTEAEVDSTLEALATYGGGPTSGFRVPV